MKKAFSVFMAVFMLCFVCGCAGGQNNLESLKNIVAENGYDAQIDIGTLEIVSSLDLNAGVQGLKSSENYDLMLLACDQPLIELPVPVSKSYKICAVDFENEKMLPFEYGEYFPLTVILDFYIQFSSSRIQQQNFNIISSYINKYGFDFCQNTHYADMYIRRITGANGFIPLSEAQGLIDGALPSLFEGQDFDSVEAVFEEGSAVPTSYRCTKETDGEKTVVTLDRDFGELFTSNGEITEDAEPGDEEYVYDEFRFVEEDEHPANTDGDEQESNVSSAPTIYKVRKGANQAASQLGAFSDLNNAKKLADEKKADGYKVYDQDGKLIYTP